VRQRGPRLEPVGAEVEEREDEDGEQQRAVDAGPVQEVGGGDEEEEVDGGSIGAAGEVSRSSCARENMGLRLAGRL
jgi:hypothetical protein